MLMMKTVRQLLFVTLVSAISGNAPAARVDFTGVDISLVASPAGQNFSYFPGTGVDRGTLNVRLLSAANGAVSLKTGSSPDPTGFYVLQSPGNLTPVAFRFTFDTPHSFQIDQNETLTSVEVNAFTQPVGSWNVLSLSFVNQTNQNSTIGITGVGTAAPYGNYSLAGAGAYFDFQVANSPFFSLFGSSISLDVGAESGPALQVALPEVAHAALTWSTNYPGYTLEGKSTLSTTSWQVVTNVVTVQGAQFSVTAEMGEAPRFFRLRKN